MTEISVEGTLTFSLTGTRLERAWALVNEIGWRYDEIIGSYRLGEDESIPNSWRVSVARGKELLLGLPSGWLDDGELGIVPSLLIYLKIFRELGGVEPDITQLTYRRFDGSGAGVLTVPIGSADRVILTRVSNVGGIERMTFGLADLERRNFVVGIESSSIETDFLPPN